MLSKCNCDIVSCISPNLKLNLTIWIQKKVSRGPHRAIIGLLVLQYFEPVEIIGDGLNLRNAWQNNLFSWAHPQNLISRAWEGLSSNLTYPNYSACQWENHKSDWWSLNPLEHSHYCCHFPYPWHVQAITAVKRHSGMPEKWCLSRSHTVRRAIYNACQWENHKSDRWFPNPLQYQHYCCHSPYHWRGTSN